MSNDLQVQRVRGYLQQLTPQARSSLLVEIERMQLYGEVVAGSEILLAELRAEFRKGGQTSDRVGNPSRHFFKPIEMLFVDRPPERAHAGQISRGSLSPIWEWINQALLPTMARDYCDKMKQVLVMSNPHQAGLIADGFQSKVVKTLEGTLASEDGVQAALAGLGRFTSSRASINDLRKVMSALRIRQAITALNKALPAKIENLEGETLATIRDLLDAFAAEHPDEVPFGLTMVMKRLKHPWQLVDLTIKTARKKKAEDIKVTRYAVAVTMVLEYLDDKRLALNHALKNNRVLIAKDILTEIYDTESELRRQIRHFENSDWGRQLEELMARVTADLDAEFHTLPEDIHHVLGSQTIRRHHWEPGLLNSLVRKSRELIGLG